MITKELIRKGFERNIISIENEFGGCINICCRIGNNAFYFVGIEDENLTVDEYWKSYSMNMTIDMLYEILKNMIYALKILFGCLTRFLDKIKE